MTRNNNNNEKEDDAIKYMYIYNIYLSLFIGIYSK